MLHGRTALIVEEEFLIALDIQRMLEAMGVAQTLFARTADEAEQLRARWPEIAIAVLEIHAGDTETARFAQSLAEASIPVVLITADLDADQLVAPGAPIPILVKPVPDHALADAVRQALGGRS